MKTMISAVTRDSPARKINLTNTGFDTEPNLHSTNQTVTEDKLVPAGEEVVLNNLNKYTKTKKQK